MGRNHTGGAGGGAADDEKAKADAEARTIAKAEEKAKADAEAGKAEGEAALREAETRAAESHFARLRSVAEAITTAATPVVRVTAVRDRWRAKRFWPKGNTDLTLAEAEQLGNEGFEQLRDDPTVFTITPLQAD